MAMTEVGIRLALEGQQQVQAGVQGVSGRLDDLDKSARQAATGAETLKTAMASLATVGSVVALVKMADAVTTLQTQLRLSANSAAEASRAYGALFNIAQQGRVSFTELGNTYASIARAGKELGVSQDRLLNVTKSISQAMTIGGGSAASMQAALVQLGQGLSSGTLRGEELNSIMEQTPRLAKAIAEGLGVPIGKLRELGAAGELTAQQVIGALEKAGPALAKEMDSATLTVGQAFTMLSNSTVKFVGDADQASGASATLAGALKTVSSAIDTIGGAINNNQTAFAAIAGGLGGAAAVAGLAAVAANIGKVRTAFVALSAVMAANPITLTLLGIGAAVGAAYSMVEARAKTLEGMKSTLKELEALNAKSNTALYGTKVSDEVYKKRQEDIARLRGEIANLESATDSYGQLEAKRLAEGTEAWKAQEKAQSDVSALWKSLSKTPDSYIKAMQEIGRLHASGALTGKAYLDAIDAAHQLLPKAAAATSQLSEEQKKTNAGMALFNDLMAEASGYNANFTEQVTQLAAAYQHSGMSAKEYATALQDILGKQKGYVDSLKDQEAAAKAYNDALSSIGHASAIEIESLTKAIEAQRLHNAEIGKTPEQIARIKQAVEERATAELEANADILQSAITLAIAEDSYDSATLALWEAKITSLREQIRLRGMLAGEIGTGAALESVDALGKANKKAAEESSKYWEDALMRAFESGKGFFQSLWDTIKNTLKTQVLKVLVTGTLSGLGLTGVANASTNPLGLASTVNALSNLPTTIGNLATAVTNLPSLLSSSSMGALDIAGFNPWLAAGAALLAVVSNLGKGETRAGGQYGYSLDGATAYNARRGTSVAASGVGATFLEGPSGGDPYGQVVSTAINSTVDHINALFKAIGSTTAISAFQAGYETSEKGRGGVFAGGTLTGGVTFGESGKGDNYAGTLYDSSKGFNLDAKAAITALSLDLKQATIEALQAATDIPKTIKDMINVDAKSLTDEAATAILNSVDSVVGDVVKLGAVFDALPFAAMRDLSFDASAGLIKLSGSLDQLVTDLQSYYDKFYTSAEKYSNTVGNINTTLNTARGPVVGGTPGIDVSSMTRSDWRSMVDTAMNDNSAAGQKWLATLLKLSPAVDAVIAAQEQLAATNKSWSDKLLVLQGKRTAQDVDRENALAAATDESTKAIMRQVYAEEDRQAAIKQTSDNIKSTLGFDAEGLSQMIMSAALNPEAGISAAESFSNALETTIKTQLLSNTVSSIATSVFNSIITPMMIGQKVSDATLDAIVADGVARMKALDALFNSEDFLNGIARIGTTLSGVFSNMPSIGGAIGGSVGGAIAQSGSEIAQGLSPIAEALKSVADRIAALKPTDTAATRAAEIAKALADFGSDGTWIEKLVPGGGRGGTDIWIKEFIASNENAVTRALQELYNLEDKKKADEAQSAIRALQAELAKYWGDGALAASVLAGNRADTLKQLNEQDPSGKLAKTQQDVWDATVIYDFNRALLEASGDTAGLAAFDKAAENTALLLEGWSQSQIDQINTAKVAGVNNGWVEKIAVLKGEYTDRQLQHTKDLAAATDKTTQALIDQYYAQLDIADATAMQTNLLDRYKKPQTAADAWGAISGAGIDIRGTAGKDADWIRQWFSEMVAAADPLTVEGQATIATLNGLSGAIDVIAQSATGAATKAAELAKTNAGWQSQLNVLLGNKTQKEVDRAAALAEVTDESTRALMLQVYAQQDMADAATAAMTAMQKLSQEIDQVASFKESIGASQQNIRSQMVGYDAVAYAGSQVDKYRTKLGAATTTQGRVDAGSGLRDAIVERYNAELALINKNRDAAEQSARAAFDAQVAAENQAIQSANALNAAYRQIGEYVKGLITGNDSPFSGASRFAAAQGDYARTLALAQGGDKDALAKLTGAHGAYLSIAKEQSVSSVDYARTFGRTVNELSALAAKAGPDLESVTRQFYFDSSAYDAQALDLQTSTVAELEDLSKLTDEWTADLQDQLAEQALTFATIGLNTQQTAEYTSKIEPGFERISVAIESAMAAQRNSDSLLIEIQSLRAEVVQLRAVSQKTADNTKATADVLDSATGGGGPMLVEGASTRGVLVL